MTVKLDEKAIELSQKLTDLERKIVLYLMNNSTASHRDAYIASGGKAKTENTQDSAVSTMLSNVKVKAFHEHLISIAATEAIVTKEYVLKSFKNVAERCMTAEAVLDEDGEPIGEWKFDSSGANSALKSLGSHLKLFTDKKEVALSGAIGLKDALNEAEKVAGVIPSEDGK